MGYTPNKYPAYDHRFHYNVGDMVSYNGGEYECVKPGGTHEHSFKNNTYIPRPPPIEWPLIKFDDAPPLPARVTTEGVSFNAPAPIFIISMFAVAIVSALIGAYFG